MGLLRKMKRPISTTNLKYEEKSMKLSSKKSALAFTAVLGLLVFITGCTTPPPAPKPTEAEKPVSAAKGSQFYEKKNDITYSWQGFPQNVTRPQDAFILVEREVPTEVRPNEDIRYVVRLTNQSTFTVDEIVHTEVISNSLEFVNAEPYPEERDGNLVWTFDGFGPGESQTITIEGKSIRTGSLRYTGDTSLGFGLGTLALSANAILPELSMNLNNPSVALIKEPIPVTISLRNSGTAPVIDARLVHTFPKGLLTEDGKSRIEQVLGDFNPGEVKTVDLILKGVETGRYETQLRATAKDGIAAVATLETSVVKPELVITADAPKLRYVGNIIAYTIEVKNVGDGVADETKISQTLSDGTSLASADQGGVAEGRTVVWNVGMLSPGQSKIVTTRVVGERIMIARSTTYASAKAADTVQSVMVTDVEGIEALLVEVVDDNDPVPVGEFITYDIEVTNTGSLEATGINVEATLTPEMEFVESTGASKSRVDGNAVVFDTLPALAPSAKATWKVRVKAVGEGDLRFRLSVKSDQLDRPVSEEESSNFYN
jgi:uncharacterized repeat protein (TIGR01451 family)